MNRKDDKDMEVFETGRLDDADISRQNESMSQVVAKSNIVDEMKLPSHGDHDQGVLTDTVKPLTAFEVFSGRVFDPLKQPGAEADVVLGAIAEKNGQLESMPRKQQRFEGPLQRYQRLVQEVAEFQKDMQQLSEQASKPEDESTKVAKLLSNHVKNLQTDLQSIVDDQNLKPLLQDSFPLSQSVVSQKTLTKHLEQQLQLAEQQQSGGGDESKSDGGSGANVTYELYYKPQDAAKDEGTLGDLDQRLVKLEKIIGEPTTQTGFADIHTALTHLQHQLDLLDQNKLAGVYRQIKSLMSELEHLESVKTQAGSSSANEQKINKMYEMMAAWDEAAQQLPAVIARLQSLKELHEHSAETVARVQNVATQQADMNALLVQDMESLAAVEKSLDANAKTMRANVASIEERIDTLMEKIAKLES
eukprot:TRINITY_DN84972_c0_g1_i1.p1 TRINITY_DN84972_c0_g1~~TRINITY_DN84972_c0_g1_i1.p1  ORF type:complete len:418 (+),score=248.00 TRINITY_DN84972_c0_g1_i1:45-1298(+)